MKIGRKKLFSLISVIAPLIMGGIFYYIFCPEVYFVKIIDNCINLNMHITSEVCENMWFRILRNHLFDYLWAYAFTNALFLVFDNNNKGILGSCICSVLVGSVLEGLQLVGMVSGTFDIRDILFEMLGAITATFIIKIIRRKGK